MSDADIDACIHWWSEENYVVAGAQFWIDELARRRTQRVLDAIAAATAADAQQVERLTELIAAGAEQNAEMVKLNRRMFWLTAANVLLAAAAVTVAIIALAAT